MILDTLIITLLITISITLIIKTHIHFKTWANTLRVALLLTLIPLSIFLTSFILYTWESLWLNYAPASLQVKIASIFIAGYIPFSLIPLILVVYKTGGLSRSKSYSKGKLIPSLGIGIILMTIFGLGFGIISGLFG